MSPQPADGLSPEQELTCLRPLARQFPTLDSALAEVARLSAERTLPKGTIHIISDIHGDDTKLRHVINNASGQLRPLLEQMFAKRLPPEELQELIALVFYPRESIERVRPTLKDFADEQRFCRRFLRHLFEIVRKLAPRRSRKWVLAVFPPEFGELLQEMLQENTGDRGREYCDELIDGRAGKGWAVR